MRGVGRPPGSPRNQGNNTKRLRFNFAGDPAIDQIIRIVGLGKSESNHKQSDGIPPDPADREWVEGNPKLVTHLRRERGSGLAKAKKDAFKLEHGRLFCEECKMDPIEVYGQNGEACIEVHHKLSLSAIQAARQTRLKDLKCVCANCHRIIHRELRNTDGP